MWDRGTGENGPDPVGRLARADPIYGAPISSQGSQRVYAPSGES
jgi:hypothetical protein